MSSEQNWTTLVSLGLNNAHINNLSHMLLNFSYDNMYIIIILQKCSKVSYQTSLIAFPAHNVICIVCPVTCVAYYAIC